MGIRAKVVVFGQSGSNRAQNGCILAKLLYSVVLKVVVWLYFGTKVVVFGCIQSRTKVVVGQSGLFSNGQKWWGKVAVFGRVKWLYWLYSGKSG